MQRRLRSRLPDDPPSSVVQTPTVKSGKYLFSPPKGDVGPAGESRVASQDSGQPRSPSEDDRPNALGRESADRLEQAVEYGTQLAPGARSLQREVGDLLFEGIPRDEVQVTELFLAEQIQQLPAGEVGERMGQAVLCPLSGELLSGMSVLT